MVSQHVLFDESSFIFGRARLTNHDVVSKKPVSTGGNVPDDDLPVLYVTQRQNLTSSSTISGPLGGYDSALNEDEDSSDGEDLSNGYQTGEAIEAAVEHTNVDMQSRVQYPQSPSEVQSEIPRRYPSRSHKSPSEWWKAPKEANLATISLMDPFFKTRANIWSIVHSGQVTQCVLRHICWMVSHGPVSRM